MICKFTYTSIYNQYAVEQILNNFTKQHCLFDFKICYQSSFCSIKTQYEKVAELIRGQRVPLIQNEQQVHSNIILMKEDSLLSSLSNISYYAHNNSDFFNDSAPVGGYPELRVKQPKEQEEVNLDELPAFNQTIPASPKNNGLLLEFWTARNKFIDGNSENLSEYGQSEIHLYQNPLTDTKQTLKIQEKPQKATEISSSSEDCIGTVTKNQTKNIPKNYGKAIITYIQKQRENFQQILRENGVQYDELLAEVSKKKKYINTIANLRELWVDFKYARCMRILSNQFLRKYALEYIFNSRICNYTSHVKYRKRLQEAIETPGSFKHIKQY